VQGGRVDAVIKVPAMIAMEAKANRQVRAWLTQKKLK